VFVREHYAFGGAPMPSPWSEHRDALAAAPWGLREVRRVLGPAHCVSARLQDQEGDDLTPAALATKKGNKRATTYLPAG
jgi:hypothetical protein